MTHLRLNLKTISVNMDLGDQQYRQWPVLLWHRERRDEAQNWSFGSLLALHST